MTDIRPFPHTIALSRCVAVLERLEVLPADPLLGLIELFQSDTRPSKMDLGVGVYKDPTGATPIMPSVKQAESVILETQQSKSYYSSEGNLRFLESAEELVFSDPGSLNNRISACQSIGGTGGLQLGAALSRKARSHQRIWVGTLTWPNHVAIFENAGLEVLTYDYYNPASHQVMFDNLMSAVKRSQPGDLFLMHACCHNPTGADLDHDQWKILAHLMLQYGVIPFIDSAYLGMGKSFKEDAWGLRLLVNTFPEALVAVSFSKNFGLYRERTGVLFALSPNASCKRAVDTQLRSVARATYSNPPDHGAEIVATILASPSLKAQWHSELTEAANYIREIRNRLASYENAGAIQLSHVKAQNGTFSLLSIDYDQVLKLRRDFGIYVPYSGRINVAGLQIETIDPFVSALHSL
nr:aromatic amino acid transaminase [Pseudomonas agarici]